MQRRDMTPDKPYAIIPDPPLGYKMWHDGKVLGTVRNFGLGRRFKIIANGANGRTEFEKVYKRYSDAATDLWSWHKAMCNVEVA